MSSLEYAQMRLEEAVATRHERSTEEQRSLLADLLAAALAASRDPVHSI